MSSTNGSEGLLFGTVQNSALASLMLAVRRPSVTEAIHLLGGIGIIRARRAHITIIDHERLEETAGDSYGIPEAEYERFIPRSTAPRIAISGPGFGKRG